MMEVQVLKNGQRIEVTQIDNSFCPTGRGGGVDPTCSPGKGGGEFAVGSKVQYKGKEYTVSGGGMSPKRGPNKGRKPMVLKGPGGEMETLWEDELGASDKETKKVLKDRLKPKEKKEKKEVRKGLSMEEHQQFYEPLGGGSVSYKTRDKSVELLDSLSPKQRDHILDTARRRASVDADLGTEGLVLVKVKLGDVKKTQFGEDYLNDSSRESARTIAKGNKSDIAMADISPIILDKTLTIKDGHHRHAAASVNKQKQIYALVPKGTKV